MLQVLVRNQSRVGLSFFDQAIVSAGNFAAGVILARNLGIADFGQLTLILVVVTLLISLCGYLLTAPMMTFASDPRFVRRGYNAATSTMAIGLATLGSFSVVVVLAFLFGYRGDGIGDLSLQIVLAGLLFFLTAIQENVRRRAFAFGSGAVGVMSDGIRYLGLPLVLLLLFSSPENHSLVTVECVIALTLAVSLLPALAFPRSPSVSRPALAYFARSHWHYSRWFLAAVFLGAAYDQLLLVAAGTYLGDREISAWRAALYVVGIMNPLLLALENFLPTETARLARSGGQDAVVKHLVVRLVQLCALSGPVIIGLFVFSSDAMALVFGPQYAGFGDVLRFALVAYCITLVRAICQHYFRALLVNHFILGANCVGGLTALALLTLSHNDLLSFQLANVAGNAAALAILMLSISPFQSGLVGFPKSRGNRC